MMADAGGSDRRLRLRAVLARSFAILVAVTLLTAGVGAAVTYDVYGTEPATRLESQTVSSWAAVGSFDHAATVTNGTEAFPEGTVLANRSLYFTRVSPELTGVFEYDYDTTETPPGDATIALSVEYRSVEGATENTTVYWRVTDSLGDPVRAALNDPDPVAAPFAVNVTAAGERLQQLDAEVGGSPGTLQVAVLAAVEQQTTTGVERRTYRLPLSVSGGSYTVTNAAPAVADGTVTEAVRVTLPRRPAALYGGPVALVAGLSGLVGLVIARGRGLGSLTDAERARLDTNGERAEFVDWITVGRVPATALDGPIVEVKSLAGLVDLAIDADRRVIEDTDDARFVVCDDTLSYVYRPQAGGDEALASDSDELDGSDTGVVTDGDGADAERTGDEPDSGGPDADEGGNGAVVTTGDDPSE